MRHFLIDPISGKRPDREGLGKGHIQVYTGNGKGKTTSALGLALRAAGAGLKVFIAQFIKKEKCSEHVIIEQRLRGLIIIKQFGKGLILGGAAEPIDIKAAQMGLEEVRCAMASNKYDLVILDEANVAIKYNLVGLSDLLEIMENKPEGMELVITGRYADPAVIEKADLVTEMKIIKHYEGKGVRARQGIEY